MGLRVALSTKLREGKLAIVDSLDVEVRSRLCWSGFLWWRKSRSPFSCLCLIELEDEGYEAVLGIPWLGPRAFH